MKCEGSLAVRQSFFCFNFVSKIFYFPIHIHMDSYSNSHAVYWGKERERKTTNYFYLILFSVIVIQKCWQCKAGRIEFTPCLSGDPSPTIPTLRKKEEEGKTAEVKKGASRFTQRVVSHGRAEKHGSFYNFRLAALSLVPCMKH